MLATLRSLARTLLRRSRFEAEMNEELRFHLEERVAHLVREGAPPAEARRRARLEFGATERVREECRQARGLRAWDAFGRNLRFALRLLRRDPAFTAAAVLTLGLCIGANTAVFSVVDAVLLRPLPYPQPDRLAQVVTSFLDKGVYGEQTAQTGQVWEAVRDHGAALDAAVTAGMTVNVNLAGRGGVSNVRQHRVSAGFFRVLGVAPARGREFSAEEDRPNGPPVVVLSHDLWSRAFDRDPSVVGQEVLLRGQPFTVVGVMPAGFQSIEPADVWTPIRASREGEGGGSNYTVIARVKAGSDWPHADTEASQLGGEIFRNMDLPQGSRAWLHLIPLQRGLTEGVRRALLLLWAAVIAVLLIGCANVASLLLARGTTRTREIATRAALGGGRSAVVAQLLTESLLLAILGGIAGLALGWAVLRALEGDVAEAFGLWQPMRLDARVLGATLAVTAVTSLLFGLLPAWRIARVDLRRALVEGGARGIAGSSRQWPRRLLVVGQVSVGLALVVGAGLLVRTAAGLYAQPPGFDGANVLTAQVSLEDARYTTTAAMMRLFDGMLSRVRTLPGVTAAGAALTLPYERALNLGFKPLDGRTGGGRVTSVVYVTPGFFPALRIAIVKGRDFDDRDRRGAPMVAAVNGAFARYYYQNREMIAEKISVAGGPREIVAMIGDVQQRPGWGEFGPVNAVPTVYVPAAQMPDASLSMIHTWFEPNFVVRGGGATAALASQMQEELRRVDPLLPVSAFRSMADVRSRSLADQRVRAQLLGGLALLALVLTFVGLYGLIASGVAERLHELGIRLALGASRAQTLRHVASQGVVLAAAGIVGGGGLAYAGVRTLRGMVWGVALFDPWTFGGAAAGVLLLALVASLVPAWRATRLDPASVLRSE